MQGGAAMIFPDINLKISEVPNELKPLKEYAWDFEGNNFLLKDGKFQTVKGAEALKIWIWKAIRTERYRYMAYSFDYGSEIDSLIGKAYTNGIMKSEIERYLKEALLISPYIYSIESLAINLSGSSINIDFVVNSVYGEVKMNV